MANPCATANGFWGSVTCYIRYWNTVSKWRERGLVHEIIQPFLDQNGDDADVSPANVFELAVKLKDAKEVDSALQMSRAIVASISVDNVAENVSILVQNLRFQAELLTSDEQTLQSQQLRNLAAFIELTGADKQAKE